MEKIAFYGLGAQFELNVVRNNFVRERLNQCRIVGFIDQNKYGNRIVFNGVSYLIVSLNQWEDYSVDKIFVTSIKYQNEIRENLIEHGFRNEQIGTLDQIIFQLFDHRNLIESRTREKGLEIGGPSDIFSSIYDMCKSCDGVNFSKDTIWWKQNGTGKYIYKNREMGNIHIADATDLMDIQEEAYDFVLSSNNLEHIANPIKAFCEFYRVVKQDGIIIIVVPRKYVNFDHNRQFTTFDHILMDYKNNVMEDDLSHLPEIVEKHDYDMDPACGGKDKFVQRASKNIENRCLHHHVFDKECLMELFAYFNLEVLEFAETYSDYWIVGKK